MISLIVYGKSSMLQSVVQQYIQAHSDVHVVEYTDRLEVAIPATLALLPNLIICEDIEPLDICQLMRSTAGHVPSPYYLACGTKPEHDQLLELMRCGLRDCIPAPWNADDLYCALDRFYTQFRAKENVQENTQTQVLRRVLDKKFFEDTIVTDNGQAILSDFAAISYEYQISFHPGFFQAVYILLDPRPQETLYADAFFPVFQLESIARKFFMDYFDVVVCYVKDHGISILLNAEEKPSDLRNILRSYIALCQRQCDWFSNMHSITAGVGLASQNAEEIPPMMQSAKMAGWMRLSEGKGRVLFYEDYFERYYDKADFLSDEEEKVLRYSIEQMDLVGCQKIIREQLEAAVNVAACIAKAIDINDVCIDAFNSAGRHAVVQNSKYLQLAQNMPPMVENLDGVEQIIHAILPWVQQSMMRLQEQDTDQEEREIVVAKQYIAANYNQVIRLEDVAATVNLSVPYFCQKFRKATGETFVGYLTKYRIERARDMIKNSNKKIYEIALEVGFQDSRHFSRTFHKIYGMLPTEYRESGG